MGKGRPAPRVRQVPPARYLQRAKDLVDSRYAEPITVDDLAAAAGLSRALASRDASKVYWALVKGVPKQKHGFVKAALAKEGTRGKGERMAVSEEEDAKFALTEYAVMGQAGQEFAWIAARPVTGRTHQIRVHLASLGTPIVGDFKYGGTEAKGKGAIADKLHLHARTIDIARPDGGRL